MISTSTALARIDSPDEREYAQLLISIESQNDTIRDLEAAVAPLEAALSRFEWEYQARLGALLAELRDLEGVTERIEHRTARIHARLVCDPGGVLGDLFDREELLEIGELFGIEIPESWFADAPEPAQRRGFGEWDEQTSAEEEILRRLREREFAAPRNADPEARTLYRDLARRFHPDLATSEDDRLARQEMMLKINAAWQGGDLDALKKLHQDTEHLAPNWHESVIARRLAWARRERDRLRERIGSLQERMRMLRSSDTFPLWFDAELGNAVIARQALALRADIARQKERLESAKEAFRQALHAFAVASRVA